MPPRHSDEARHGRTSADDIADELARRQQQLMEIQRQSAVLERQKRELEELAQKQDEVEVGRKEMIEKLQRAIVILEREEESAGKQLEQIAFARKSFIETLQDVGTIQTEVWSKENIAGELTHALTLIDHAKAVYNQNTLKLQALKSEDSGAVATLSFQRAETPFAGEESGVSFAEWVRRGFAFHLPLLVFGFLFLVVFVLKK